MTSVGPRCAGQRATIVGELGFGLFPPDVVPFEGAFSEVNKVLGGMFALLETELDLGLQFDGKCLSHFGSGEKAHEFVAVNDDYCPIVRSARAAAGALENSRAEAFFEYLGGTELGF
ncbi:hypothetical protein BEL07_25580 [Mycolicibacterium grossiae]|uniref:Uncharacterized protein n=1 Tax=Mycolicibacterium grossiae TaxID=1552759 RepID=A0A1E8PXD5_9MYCO|nr:hypothetical protein BEL07_25580 [Mycolicibacterium grossiae]